jgi:hypothetical protein
MLVQGGEKRRPQDQSHGNKKRKGNRKLEQLQGAAGGSPTFFSPKGRGGDVEEKVEITR